MLGLRGHRPRGGGAAGAAKGSGSGSALGAGRLVARGLGRFAVFALCALLAGAAGIRRLPYPAAPDLARAAAVFAPGPAPPGALPPAAALRRWRPSGIRPSALYRTRAGRLTTPNAVVSLPDGAAEVRDTAVWEVTFGGLQLSGDALSMWRNPPAVYHNETVFLDARTGQRLLTLWSRCSPCIRGTPA